MYSRKMTGSKAWKVLAFLLAIAFIFSFIPVNSFAAQQADDQTATASFTNISEDGGDDVIALTTARQFKAMIPITGSGYDDPANVVWSLDRDADKQYNDPEQYPNQSQGGALDAWKNQNNKPLFSDITTAIETVDDQNYLTVTFSNCIYFEGRNGIDPSAPHSNGGAYLDVCGYFDLTADYAGEEVGSVPVKVVPYDKFHTMAEIYSDLDDMVDFAAEKTDLYVEKFSMGKSTGAVYEPLDMPYLIVASDKAAVANWLKYCDKVEKDPSRVIREIQKGKYKDLQVPILYSNVHANEVAAADGVMDFAWKILNAAASEKKSIEYKTLDSFTTEGKDQLEAEMNDPKRCYYGDDTATGVAVPDLVKDTATYLGYLQDGNGKSGVVDLDKYYNIKDNELNIDELFDEVFFILVPEENVEGRTYVTRTASNGYDLNRDNSFQTTNETANMQKLIGTFNPISFTEFHGRVTDFQCEPCDPPHEPNFEYDLLAEHLLTGGEAFGNAAVANNKMYNSYVMPQRDYLSYTDAEHTQTRWFDPWDDMSTSYTPQFAMLHGTPAYTVELPGYNDAGSELVSMGCVGQSAFIAGEKESYLKSQAEIYERSVYNENSDDFDLVGQWFCDMYDNEGAEMDLFRPEFDGKGQNGNFYPEYYIIPLDGENQSNLDSAYQMMEWLSRNDVKILLTDKEFEYGGVTYPKGTMIITMYQAKRSVANGALYDGTLIQSWPGLYSEGITSFNETRGFDMVTVADKDGYDDVKPCCGKFMDYDDCLAYIEKAESAFSGIKDAYVIISNVSEDSTSAVNALLKDGAAVGMITDADSEYYDDFVCAYDDWTKVASEYLITGTGVSKEDVPEAAKITKAPSVFITGASSPNTSGFVWNSRVSNANWNYDRIAMNLMNFNIVDTVDEADVVAGASTLSGDAQAAVQKGMPYIGYGSTALSSRNFKLLGSDVFARSGAGGMDCLPYVTYPAKNMINGTYVNEDDDVMYGYGNGYISKVPEGAEILVKVDGTKEPTEGFIPAISDSQKSQWEAFHNDSVLGIAYKGKGADDADLNIALFANSLTHKVHQRDEYSFISNFIFSSLLGDPYFDEPPAPVNPYTDVKDSDWFFDAVVYMTEKKLMSGVGNNKFDPHGDLNRAMTATILYRLAGEPEVSESDVFSDVPAGQWYSAPVAWAAENGITTGYEDKTFRPNTNVTREQFATFLSRYAAKLEGVDLSEYDNVNLEGFNDYSKISSFAVQPMKFACGTGIMNGSDNNLLPQGNAERCQSAAMIQRFCNNVID